jgi:hypothetical protein
VTDQEYIDRHYITGGRMTNEMMPEEIRLTPGEQVVVVLISTVMLCIAVVGILALLRIAA